MAILTSKAFPSDQHSNLLISIFIVVFVRNEYTEYSTLYLFCTLVHNYSILYTGQCTLRRIACIETRDGEDIPPNPLVGGVGTLKGTVTKVPANDFTININFTSGNMLIKADYS